MYYERKHNINNNKKNRMFQAMHEYFQPFTDKSKKYDPNAFSRHTSYEKSSPPGLVDTKECTNFENKISKTNRTPANIEKEKKFGEGQRQPRYGDPDNEQQYGKLPIIKQNDIIRCPPREFTQESPVLGGWMMPNGEERFSRRFIDSVAGVAGTQPENIKIIEPPHHSKHGDRRATGTMTPSWNKYSPELYSSQVLDSELRQSTGFIVNSHTGRMYETFEEDIPGPTTDQSIPRENFEHTNPFLIWKQGGIDPNRAAPNKKEVCQGLPRKDDGPNVWGDQLYADRRRSEIQTRVNREVWQNRNGEFSVEAVDDRRPVGYVGFQPAYRPLPYLVATQRTTVDSEDYTPISEVQIPPSNSRDISTPSTTVRKIDIPEIYSRTAGSDAANIQGEYVVSVNPTVKDTNRQTTSIHSVTAAVNLANVGAHVIMDDFTIRDTLKDQMEQAFGPTNSHIPVNSSYVVIDTDVRETLKDQMENSFSHGPVNPSNGGTANGMYVVMDDYTLRDTLKDQMENSFEVTNAFSSQGDDGVPLGSYVVIDTDARETLKDQMENTFAAGISDPSSGSASYVVIDEDVRDTLKDQMEMMFPTANANDADFGSYVEYESDVRGTKRMNYENVTGRPSAHVDTFGNQAVTMTATSNKTLPNRGEVISEWTPSVSHISANTENTSAIVLGKHTQRTEREMPNRLPVPTRRSLQEPLLIQSCASNKNVPETVEPIRYFNPTYYTEQSVH